MSTTWTPWVTHAVKDGEGDLWEWTSSQVICTRVHDHGHAVYTPLSFLTDSLPPDSETRAALVGVQLGEVVEEMGKHGCHHLIPLPSVP